MAIDLLNTVPTESVESVNIKSTNAPQLDPATTSLVDTITEKAKQGATQLRTTNADYFPNQNEGIQQGNYSIAKVGSFPIYAAPGVLFPFALADKLRANQQYKEQAVAEATKFEMPSIKALKDPNRSQRFYANVTDNFNQWIDVAKAKAKSDGKSEAMFGAYLGNDPNFKKYATLVNNYQVNFDETFDKAVYIRTHPREFSIKQRELADRFFKNADNTDTNPSLESLQALSDTKNQLLGTAGVHDINKIYIADAKPQSDAEVSKIRDEEDYDIWSTTVNNSRFFKKVTTTDNNGIETSTIDYDENKIDNFANLIYGQNYEGFIPESEKENKLNEIKDDLKAQLGYDFKNEIKIARKKSVSKALQIEAGKKKLESKKFILNKFTPQGGENVIFNGGGTYIETSLVGEDAIDVSGAIPSGTSVYDENGNLIKDFTSLPVGSKLTKIQIDEAKRNGFVGISINKEPVKEPIKDKNGNLLYWKLVDGKYESTTEKTNIPQERTIPGQQKNIFMPIEAFETAIINSDFKDSYNKDIKPKITTSNTGYNDTQTPKDQTKPLTPSEWDSKWKSLKSGEKLVGLDGKTYTKP